MSVFDYPRINFSGTLELNPATANNCDYAGGVTLPGSAETLALIDSKMVQAITYGMDDDAFLAWVQTAQTFDIVNPPAGQPTTTQIVPAEWNFYGDLGMTPTAQVVGVTTGPGQTYSQPDGSVPVTDLIGAALTFSGGHITDVNSEGSPPATQFFVDQVTLASGGKTFLTGPASKGASQWLNFYRNVNLVADGGAGGYVYHVMRASDPGTTIDIPGFDAPGVVGVVLRYYIFGIQMRNTSNEALEALYQAQKQNPATAQIVGTLAPLFGDETMFTTPVGRLMVANDPTIPTPAGTQNNGAPNPAGSGPTVVALGPAVLRRTGMLVSADFAGTFPDYYQPGPPATNLKFDFGDVNLTVAAEGVEATVGPVDYADTATGDGQGWVVDFDISSNRLAQKLLADPTATFALVSPTLGPVLNETDYYVASNQQAIYTEQHGSGSAFLNQGTTEPASVAVYHRGVELSADECPAITVWQYRSVPMQSPGLKEAISSDHAPGQPIEVDTSQPGDFVFTFTVAGSTDAKPPESYAKFMYPPAVTNAPQISLRILPNDEDFAQYYVDPAAADPVGNDRLTFAVLYGNVLRTYYLLYPVMNFLPLNSEDKVTQAATGILAATDPSQWMKVTFMPRTRDMSASRLQLLQAFCRKVQA